MSIKLSTYPNHSSHQMNIVATFDDHPNLIADALIREIVELVAERYVKENYPQLVSLLDQQAIANLAIAESGKKIAEEIKARPIVLNRRDKGYPSYL